MYWLPFKSNTKTFKYKMAVWGPFKFVVLKPTFNSYRIPNVVFTLFFFWVSLSNIAKIVALRNEKKKKIFLLQAINNMLNTY